MFNLHSTNVCPSFDGFEGLVALSPALTFWGLILEPPWVSKDTVNSSFSSWYLAIRVISFVTGVSKLYSFSSYSQYKKVYLIPPLLALIGSFGFNTTLFASTLILPILLPPFVSNDTI